MKLKPIILIVVLLNISFVTWFMLRDSSKEKENISDVVEELVSTPTLEENRYDLSDRSEDLNVILISMDALRYDVTGLDGSEGVTPNLLEFASESVVFHQAASAAPWTLPSHMSIWTARWPSIHQVTNKLKSLLRIGKLCQVRIKRSI